MKKLFAILLAIITLLSLAACGNNSEKPIINNEVSSTENVQKPNNTETEEIYSNKVYYVGDDIPAGNYAINCTKSEYGMDILVFESEQKFKGFQGTEQFTVGEYQTAVETHAWANFYVKENEFVYVGLKKGYVILLDDGMCEFNKYDTGSSATIYSGIYVVGEDIAAGNLNIKCTSDRMQVTVFETKDNYVSYHQTSRFTVGEEADAIEKYALSSDYISKDKTTSVNLKDGMILVVDNGIGEYSIDAGPVIN